MLKNAMPAVIKPDTLTKKLIYQIMRLAVKLQIMNLLILFKGLEILLGTLGLLQEEQSRIFVNIH